MNEQDAGHDHHDDERQVERDWPIRSGGMTRRSALIGGSVAE